LRLTRIIIVTALCAPPPPAPQDDNDDQDLDDGLDLFRKTAADAEPVFYSSDMEEEMGGGDGEDGMAVDNARSHGMSMDNGNVDRFFASFSSQGSGANGCAPRLEIRTAPNGIMGAPAPVTESAMAIRYAYGDTRGSGLGGVELSGRLGASGGRRRGVETAAHTPVGSGRGWTPSRS
jgi:hypothetical protein